MEDHGRALHKLYDRADRFRASMTGRFRETSDCGMIEDRFRTIVRRRDYSVTRGEKRIPCPEAVRERNHL